MSDLISRQKALVIIKGLYPDAPILPWNRKRWEEQYKPFIEFEKVIKALPSEQPNFDPDEWCTDCKEYDHERHCCPRWNRVIRDTLRDVQSERRGKWVYEGVRGRFPVCSCSVCGNRENADWAVLGDNVNYCPNCGAKMEE